MVSTESRVMPLKRRVGQRRRVDHSVADHKNILARPLADQPIDVEPDALLVAVDLGFHADQLRVHVVGAGLGQRGHGVGRKTVPTGDADVGAAVAADVFAPREVGDVDLNGRALGADTHFAVAAQRDGPDVAGRDAVGLNELDHAGAKLLKREGQIHAVDFGRVKQALHVLGKPEDGRALRLAVAADAFKDAGAVVDDVAHDVERGFLPGNELAVVPDVGGGLDGHGGVELLLQLRSARIHKGTANLSVRVTEFGEGRGAGA